MSFLGEIKRRKVFRVAIVYAIVAWGLVEIVATVEAPLGLPDWVDTLVIVLVVVGFPLALVLSWAYDMTPAGIIRTKELESADDRSGDAGTSAEAPQEDLLANSVAVLPFENLSPNPDDAYFAAGIHEELLNQLAKIQDLRVIARTSVMRYEGARRSVSEIANELRVGTLMEGSVRYAGDRVRVMAQLIDADTEDHLWSEVYERDLVDVFAIQADIATRIAKALEAKFSLAEQQRVERPLTRSPAAYVLYLQAMAVAREGGIELAITSSKSRAALQSYLDKAIAADPDFALAYVQRARVYVYSLISDIGTEETYASRRADLERLAQQDFEKALALDPNLGVAYAGTAQMHQFNWRREEARAAHERALQLSPNDPEVLSGIAIFKALTGQHEEAINLGQRALMLDPVSANAHFWMAFIHLAALDLNAAASAFRNAIELAPTSSISHSILSQLETARGNSAVALEEAKIAEQLLLDNTNSSHLSAAIYAYGRIGCQEDARRLFEQLEETASSRRVAAGAMVQAYLGIGDDDRALDWLNRAAENPEPYEAYYAVNFLKANWLVDPLLEQPRFSEVRRRLGFSE